MGLQTKNYNERIVASWGVRLVGAFLISVGFSAFLLPYFSIATDRTMNPVSTSLVILVVAFVCYVILSLTYCMRVKVKPQKLLNGRQEPVLSISGIRHSQGSTLPVSDIISIALADYDEPGWKTFFGLGHKSPDGLTNVFIVPGYRGPGLIVKYRHKQLFNKETAEGGIQFPTKDHRRLKLLLEQWTDKKTVPDPH
jgi:hypothetical protein